MIVGRTINYNRLRNPVAAHRARATDPLRALIAQLFGNGEQGAMYVPQPTLLGEQVLYQDAAGTVPVTADGDPVGLMLDVGQKLELGPELITNGTLDEDLSGWVNATGYWQWVAGRAYHPQGSDYKELSQAFTPTNKSVVVEFDVDVISGSNTAQWFYVNAAGGAITGTTNSALRMPGGKSRVTRVIHDGIQKIGFARVPPSAAAEFYLDNISVRELPGNHATQTTSAARRLYKTNGSQSWLLDDLVDDGLVVTLPDLGTNATLAYADGSGVTILTGQTISGDTQLPTTAETYGVIYLDRPFTASEATQVTDHLNKLRGAA